MNTYISDSDSDSGGRIIDSDRYSALINAVAEADRVRMKRVS